MTDLHFAAGDLVFAEGSPSTFVLRIAAGEAEVFTTLEGKEVPLGRVKPGDYVGEMGVIQGVPRSASIRAVTALTTERFGREDFLQRISADSGMALQLLNRLSERVKVLDKAYARATLGVEEVVEPDTEPSTAMPPADARTVLRAGNELMAAALPMGEVILDPLPFTVGRMPAPGEAAAATTVDLMLDDTRPFRLSRAHFRIGRGPGGVRVMDLGSILGTLVNGQPLGRHFGADAAPLEAGGERDSRRRRRLPLPLPRDPRGGIKPGEDHVQRDEFHSLSDLSHGIQRELAPGVTTSIFPGDQAMLSVVRIEPNGKGSLHSHPEEQWGLLLEGSGVRVQGDEEIPVAKGSFWRTPGEVPHTFHAGPDGATILDIFSPPRDEYRKAGSGFGAGSEV